MEAAEEDMEVEEEDMVVEDMEVEDMAEAEEEVRLGTAAAEAAIVATASQTSTTNWISTAHTVVVVVAVVVSLQQCHYPQPSLLYTAATATMPLQMMVL